MTALFASNRIRMSQILISLALVVLMFSGRKWSHQMAEALLYAGGALLIGIATIGRLWCSLYIAGYKDGTLVTAGPYSICRNPLYFFSFIGVIGVGLATETLTFTLLGALWFAMFYPGVIRQEEERLRRLHGARYEDYCRSVPRFFPNISLFSEPDSYVVKPAKFRRHLLDALWFVWAAGILELMDRLGDLGYVPRLMAWY